MPKKILLADDSLTIQKVVELTFSDSDFELVSVSNGQRALEKVREERPDLILADVVMPEKNGYEVCEAIKGDPATAKIPVVLLSGTFEPFDRERAERIGADAIVSKPFDSQQLLSQVEALLARVSKEAPAPSSGATTVVIPMTSLASIPPASAEAEKDEFSTAVSEPEPPPIPIRQAAEPIARSADEPPPFEAGFTAEDFTGTVRLPASSEPADPFEEEYGRGGVDSAIEAFEKVRPDFGFAGESEIEIDDDRLMGKSLVEEGGGAPPQWLAEEPERTAPMPTVKPPPPPGDAFDLWGPVDADSRVTPPSGTTAVLRGPLAPAASLGRPGDTIALKSPLEMPEPEPSGSSSEALAKEEPLAKEETSAKEGPHELEALASGTTIPELTQMLSSVARSNGELSDADIERLATKVVEKLSDKVVREIAWEVIPDMAEIVIKQRIKELESGVE
jgi:CheY-like chemotaxis protein